MKLVLEENLSLPEAGRRLSLAPSTLGYWVKLYKAGKLGDVGKSYRPLTDVEMELAREERKERTGGSEDGAGHPKKSSRVLCQGVAARYAMMKQLRLDYPTSVLSRMLVVSASGYYAWVDRPPSKRAREEVRLELEIKAAHKRTRQTYGPERLQRDLAESSGPHHQDSGEAKIRESTAGVSRKPSSDCKACGCSSKHLCGLTAWNT